MAITPDPFSQLYDKVADTLEAHVPWAALVRIANRIRFDREKLVPLRESLQNADTPEVMLIPAGGTFDLTNTSTSAEAVQMLVLKAATGELRVQKIMFPLKWETARALRIAGPTLGLAFVNNVRLIEHTETVEDFDESRGQQGWVSELIIEATMMIPRIELET